MSILILLKFYNSLNSVIDFPMTRSIKRHNHLKSHLRTHFPWSHSSKCLAYSFLFRPVQILLCSAGNLNTMKKITNQEQTKPPDGSMGTSRQPHSDPTLGQLH